MKKFISVMLCVCICLSSTVFCFASATQWDTSDQANLRYIATSVTSGGSLYTLVNNIYTRVNTISNNLVDIKSYLFDSNHGIAYWVHAISTWMSPIYTAIQNTPTELESIKPLLGYVSSDGDTEVITPYLAYQNKGAAEILNDTKQYLIKKSYPTWYQNNPALRYYEYNSNGFQANDNFTSNNTSILGAIWLATRFNSDSTAYLARDLLTGFKSNQNAINWLDLSNKSFTPSSATNGIYQWLSNIQAPVARLSYILASDERIEAQEKAADNEQAIVDNFIDSSGSGAASTSDFGNVSNLSSGFKNNISTDASVSGIWNIFNTDNFGWFSQETADQLDTSGSGTKTMRSFGSYPTPLLDQQTEDILKYIGGDNND